MAPFVLTIAGKGKHGELVTVVRVEHTATRLSIGVQTSPTLGRF